MFLRDSILLDLFLLLLLSIIFLYIFFTRNFNYWKKLGIPYKEPLLLVGNFLEVVQLKKHLAEVLSDIYFETKEPYLGIFIVDKPILLVKDRELIRNVLVRDFDYFADNSFATRSKDISSKMIPFMKGNDWRSLRKMSSPAFNRLTMKSVYFDLIKEAGDELKYYLDKNVEQKELVNCKVLAEMFAAEMLTSVALGVKANCFSDGSSTFRKMAHNLFDVSSLKRDISIAAYLLYPKLVNIFQLNLLDTKVEAVFKKIFLDSVKKKENGIVIKDFVDILIKWKKESHLNTENLKLDDDTMVAQAITFFLAAFEAITSVTVMTLHELAVNSEVQRKLREEIRNSKEKSENQILNFDTIFSDFKYLDMVLKEVLRKYPPLPVFNRECTRDYMIPGTNDCIKKGTTVFIPIFAVQNDPQYFPNPDLFDPERFSEDNFQNIKSGTYLPFSDGSRSCVGEKIGLMSIKIALISIIEGYHIHLRDEGQRKMKIHPRAYVLAPEESKVTLRLKKVLK